MKRCSGIGSNATCTCVDDGKRLERNPSCPLHGGRACDCDVADPLPYSVCPVHGRYGKETQVSQEQSPMASQVGGGHYKQMPLQPVEFIHRNGIGFMEGCAIKYLCRHRSKGGAADIRKAIHFCQLLLALEYGEGK